MDEWRRMTTPESARATLDDLWAAVARGGLRPPADAQLDAELLFGTAQRSLIPDPDGWVLDPRSGPSWSTSWISPRDVFGAFDRGSPRSYPATLWRLPEEAAGREIEREYGPAALAEIGASPVTPDAFWTLPVVENAVLSDVRARLGVQGPPFPATPSGTHAAALSTATARALVDALTSYASEDPRPPLSVAKRIRAEAVALSSFADEIEPAIDATSRSWLPAANAWISTSPATAGRPKTTPATLRDR